MDAIYLDLPGNQDADAGGLVFLGSLGGHVPGQQFFNAIDFMICDMGQDVFEVGTRIDPVELARSDQTVRRGSPLAPTVGTIPRD